jgi:predicted 2-oxoglutarate/Fe(II)-dependent dioxygenase YbiX
MHDILTVKKFLSEEQCDRIIDMATAYSTGKTGIQHNLVEGWKNVSNFDFPKDSELSNIIAALHSEIANIIVNTYGVESSFPREDGYFYKYHTGDFYKAHCDAQTVLTHEGVTVGMRKPSSSDVSSIIYLNDNFVGGELEFGFKDEKIVPEKGMLALFYSGWQNTHAVRPIELGERYCIVNWFVTNPNLVPIAEAIPEPYSKSFEFWENEYQGFKAD